MSIYFTSAEQCGLRRCPPLQETVPVDELPHASSRRLHTEELTQRHRMLLEAERREMDSVEQQRKATAARDHDVRQALQAEEDAKRTIQNQVERNRRLTPLQSIQLKLEHAVLHPQKLIILC